MIKLQTERSGIKNNWVDQKFLMIGASGIGKTDFFQHSENPFYITSERGTNYVDVCEQECKDWVDLVEIMKALDDFAQKPSDFPYDLVVTDTIDRIVDYAGEATMIWAKSKYTKLDLKAINDIPNGAGWDIRRGYVAKFLKKLEQLPCAVAVIGHLETKRLKNLVRKRSIRIQFQ